MDDKTADSFDQLETMTHSAVLSGSRPHDRIAVVPGLTLAAHPDLDRVGERSALAALGGDGDVELSRLTPLFAHPGESRRRPLADPHVSRRTLRLRSRPGGGLEIQNPSRLRILAQGEALADRRVLSAAELERGVTILVADRVLLLLHPMEVLPPSEPGYGLVGESRGIGDLRRQIQRVADLEVPVLLRGETGTGKELVARSIHRASQRRRGPLVAVNMGAMTPSLAASELFGSVKGAFTGADRRRSGFFAEANGGTLFLDEIGETPSGIQPMLLRTLETHRVRPVGSDREDDVDVRILAATDANLEAAIEEGAFRAPLLHRLSGYEIHLPPLRDRREDIARLLLHFLRIELEAIGEAWRLEEPPAKRPWLPASLMERFLLFEWPGNIRQLRNAARQLLIANRGAARLHLPQDLVALFDRGQREDLEETAELEPAARARVAPARAAGTPPSDRPVVRTLVAVRWRRPIPPTDPSVYRRIGHRDELLRRLLIEYDGHEVEHSEGFLLLFERPVDALGFALGVHGALDELGAEDGPAPTAAIALFVGEVFLRTNASEIVARGARPFDVTGVAKTAARQLADLAGPRQTLLNQSAFDLSRQALSAAHPLRAGGVRWLRHGAYRIADRRSDVFEVGVDGVAPLSPPRGGDLDAAATSRRPSYRSPGDIGDDELRETLRRFAYRLQPAAKALGVSRTSLYALIDRSPDIRTAREIDRGEIEASLARHGGDRAAAAAELEVSQKGLSRRMTELGM
ncbi:MAG: sigma 54-interacting transcriptional regulator [Acidobacteriota bacterium]